MSVGGVSLSSIGFSLSTVLVAILVGVLLERFILRKLESIASEAKWKGFGVILGSLKGWIIFWSVLIGVYIAILGLLIRATFLTLIKNVLLVLGIISATFVIARIVEGFINIYQERAKPVLPGITLFSTIAKILIFTLGVLIILQSLGIAISPIIAGLGIGGLAVALALQDTLSNFFAGLHIILTKQIRPGDYVKLDGGDEGYVVDITWRNTTIRELPNNLIIIPNSKLAQARVKNYYLPSKDMAVLVQVGVSYDSDLDKVERVTIDVAKEVMREVPGGVPDFEPFIRYHTFADFSINFTVILRAKEFVDQYLIKHEFVKRLHRRYREEGIVIPFPIRTVFLEKSAKG
ncbi:MAG: hypothetical protein PWQ16_1112 [bacterium]|nr:MAG: Mechanosensitive ion channel family protein [bacterium 42_11]MDK2871760.1 hypothetical protein [bacterium]